ncbi:MAG: response regulator [Bryobacteraceae bacterium]|jgi:CheY-like chemotaxis protein
MPMLNNPEELIILLVEDDAAHACLIEKNLRRSNIMNEIVRCTDGQQALAFIFHSGVRIHGAGCYMILLDLNMPGVNGYQVLERIKADPKTRTIPIIILTTTDDEREIKRCYDLGCNVYITKPVDYENFAEAIHRLGLFLTIVSTPEKARPRHDEEEAALKAR